MAANSSINPNESTIILAGATGDLGGRIARALLQSGAKVRAIVRPGSAGDELTVLRAQGLSIVEVDFNNASQLTKACMGGSCVVSALSGLQEVILDVQTSLLHAAVEAGVPRFIPSDYAIDFVKLPAGTNRNLDLRREFSKRLDKAPIAATSVLNGMFTDLLTGQAPVILFGFKQVLYWGDAEQLLDFTTIDDTAAFTAAAALDASTPRYLRVAGQVASARDLKEAARRATGKEFGLFRAGGLRRLDTLIKFTRAVMPKNDDVFPPWQGMQYMRNMFSGQAKLEPLDNNRYPNIRWTSVQEVLERHVSQGQD
jgi:nucleoside-diphosphate-sugar epimerase